MNKMCLTDSFIFYFIYSILYFILLLVKYNILLLVKYNILLLVKYNKYYVFPGGKVVGDWH